MTWGACDGCGRGDPSHAPGCRFEPSLGALVVRTVAEAIVGAVIVVSAAAVAYHLALRVVS